MATGAYRERTKSGAAISPTVLAAPHEPPCISIFMNFDPNGSTKQELARLGELLLSVQADLQRVSMTVDQARALLEPQLRRLQEEKPARSHTPGMALFAAKNLQISQRLSVTVPERVVVAGNFFVRPVLPFVAANDRFFLLMLSENHARLLQGSREGMQELPLPEVPGLAHQDAAGHTFEKQIQFHSGAPALPGKKGIVFYGSEPDAKERILHYLRAVNEAVTKALAGQYAPLAVACVDYLFPIYKTANTYPGLVDGAVVGNPEHVDAASLHAVAWKAVEPHLDKTRQRALAEYKDLINTERTSSNLRKVLAAAQQGRVWFLFLPPDAERWGSFVPLETVHVHGAKEPGDEELLNLAAILTVRAHGQVFSAPPADFREGAEIAALFRY